MGITISQLTWFYIQIDGNFTRKYHLVDNGHKTDAPYSTIYFSVVSRDSVIIAFLVASSFDLDVCACDIGNAWLNVQYRQKLWMVSGTEFCPLDRVSVIIIARYLYVLKSSVASWRAKLAETLNSIVYCSTESYPYVWFKQDLMDLRKIL